MSTTRLGRTVCFCYSYPVGSAAEFLVLEMALSRYALENPDSRLAVRMLADVSRINEERQHRLAGAFLA
ncbi:hypothetical protein ACIRQP_24230 [Streptomyces sp. NPDC102274]|uniref:hypothetical protein n=1 Tax=Streptomyces sp. NPDC102274 TaxID=3366151 RepID=UPI003821271F